MIFNEVAHEMAAALQFPYYFGTLARFWAPTALEARQTFWTMLQRAAHDWHQPQNTHPPRAAKTFRVVVQCTSQEEQPMRASLQHLIGLSKA